MKCSTLRIGNSTAIVCGTARIQQCKECNQRPVAKLCDYKIRDVARGKLSDDQFAALTTCSRPMCEDCSRPQPDGVDYCRIHEDLAIKKETILVVAGRREIFDHWLREYRINPGRVRYVRDLHDLLGIEDFKLIRLDSWSDNPELRDLDAVLSGRRYTEVTLQH